MATSQDLARLEAELWTEDLSTLKRCRTNNRRDSTCNERYYRDCAVQDLSELDIESIEHPPP